MVVNHTAAFIITVFQRGAKHVILSSGQITDYIIEVTWMKLHCPHIHVSLFDGLKSTFVNKLVSNQNLDVSKLNLYTCIQICSWILSECIRELNIVSDSSSA